MPDTLVDAAGNPIVPTAPQIVVDAGTPGNQPDYKALYEQALGEATTYKSRFTGLQGTYQREQEKWKVDAEKVTTLASQLEALIGEKTTLVTDKTALAEEKERQAVELGILRNQTTRFNTVIEKFPQLLQFLDVLPDGVGPEWEAKLVKFQAKLGTMGADGMQKLLETAAPPAPTSSAVSTADDKLKMAQKAALTGDMKEYDRLYSEYLKEKNTSK